MISAAGGQKNDCSECDARPSGPRRWLLNFPSGYVEFPDVDDDEEDDDDDDDDDGGGDDEKSNDIQNEFRSMTERRRRASIVSIAEFGLILVLVIGAVLPICEAKISDKRMCYDEDCSVIVSLGKTILSYPSKDHDILSFPANVEVKVFSKEAGKRKDLWGVEINGKRGYAPSKFIREYKILQNSLNFTVPTEQFYNEQVKNITQKDEQLVQSDNDTISDTAQQAENQSVVSLDAEDTNLNENITPHHISPSYDNIYDGTVIPGLNEAAESPSPSYSTQTLQDNVKEDDQVRLNVYPNILTSSFSKKEILELVDEATKMINEKADESSLNSVEKQDVSSEEVVSESSIEGIVTGKVLQSEENKIIDNNKTDSLIQSQSNEIVSESKLDVQEKVEETDEQSAIKEINNVNVDEEVKNNIELVNLTKPMNNESDIKESLSPENEISDMNVESDGIKQSDPISNNLQNDSVPKQEETVAVISNSISTYNDTSAEAPVEGVILDTTVNSANFQDSINPEVPLNQETEKDSIATPNESFLLDKNLFEPNVSENDSIPAEIKIETNDNLTTPEEHEKLNLTDEPLNLQKDLQDHDNVVDSNNNVIHDSSHTTSIPTYIPNDSVVESTESVFETTESIHQNIVDVPSTSSFGEFLGNRNLLNAEKDLEDTETVKVVTDEIVQTTTSSEIEENFSTEVIKEEENVSFEQVPSTNNIEKIVLPPETCDTNYECSSDHSRHQYSADENAVTNARRISESSETLLYVCITAITTLLFSLGYYFIENRRRDAYLIAKINNLEKDLMITRKECIMLDENFKSTKTKLDSIEDESFGSNEMVLSLKAELAASENTRVELEDQIASLEKELESTSEAGLELERMLREILSSQSEENNPLAQSIEDLQVRLNEQQIANESLQNALTIKTQENETLTGDLTVSLKKVEQLQGAVSKLSEELSKETASKIELEQSLSEQVQKLELQIKTVNEDKTYLRKQLKLKELEVKELMGVVETMNLNNIDLEKLCEVSQIKAEAAHLLEERDELKIKLSEEEGAYQLLEEHVKLVKEEVAFLSEQCKVAEKEKKEAETKLEVLTKFFEEKEAQRQKEEAMWLEKQGEVSSTVERIQTMQNEILNYKQQIEMLKREILDQEREYKNQIVALETKAHEQWVAARQHERRLEEVKAESSQLRNRLTLVEKNINDGDPEVKLHRLQGSNGDAGIASHPLYPGAETSSSPLMFGGSGSVPPPLPPPSYHMYGPGPFPPPPFLPPPLPSGSGSGGGNPADVVGSRPPPLGGGRLSSPPPTGNPVSLPPMSPPPLPFPPPPRHGIRSPPPPLPPFGGDVPPPPLHHMPPLPPPSSLHHHQHHHQPQQSQQQQSQQQQQQQQPIWGDEETLPPMRNSSGFYQHHQRDQRSRNHKGSLHSSGESLDKSHHSGKV